MVSEKHEWETEFNEILCGIDETETESDNGWWETQSGADSGKEVKQKLRDFIIKLLNER